MAKRRESYVHEWFDLVDKSGLVMSEPVLHVHFPAGPEPVDRTDTLGLQVRSAVEKLILALDAADHAGAGRSSPGRARRGCTRPRSMR